MNSLKLNFVAIAALCFSLYGTTSMAAQGGPGPKDLQFSVQKMDSFQGLLIQFTPSPNHHFNMEAPTQVSLLNEGKTLKADLDKSPSVIKASWNEKSAHCQITAQLYLCDDKNTYCVPVKKTLACDKLTYDKTVTSQEQGMQSESTKTATATEAKLDHLFLLNDSAKAFEAAKTQKKLILIDFFGIWCPPCNILDETVFSTSEFQKLNQQYVFLKMDADASTSWDLKTKYNIKGYPTVILANAEGEEISRVVGSRKAKAFVAEMRKALKFKTTTLAERKLRAESLKDPQAAFAMADLALGQEDYLQANKYFLMATKLGSPSAEQKQKMLSAQIGLLENSTDVKTQKNLAVLLESTLLVYPYGVEALERADQLVKLADDLKDESLKNRAHNAQFKNAEYLLKNPKLYADSELTEPDLYTVLADVYDSLKDEAKTKEYFGKAYEAYTRELKALKLDESKERGHNIERIYCLYKSGKTQEANALFESMQTQYPEEFTFFYNHASLLSEDGKNEEALAKAEKALKYSYGDNQLRAVKLVANLKSKTGKKKEAISLLDETLKNFKAPTDPQVRTHRYLTQLRDLREKMKQ